MPHNKELRLRYFEQAGSQQHIEASDHYLYRQPSPHLNFAVIGTGTIGLEHMRVTLLEGRARVHGIFDPNASSIQMAMAEYGRLTTEQPIIYDSLEQAIADPDLDALIICSPNHTHLDVLQPVLDSGKAVLLEKPMATTLSDAAEVVRLSDASPGLLQIGLQYRYKATYVEARYEALERQSLGSIKTISILEHRPPFLDKVGQWNKFSRYSGGTLVEKCCHYFDLMNMFAGARPQRVFASGGQAVNFVDFEHQGKTSDIADHALVTVEYRNGVRASLNLSMFCPNFYEELVLCGDGGRLKASEEFNFLHGETMSNQINIEHGEDRASRVIKPRYPEFIERSGHHGATYVEHQRFVDQIDGKDSDAADVREGFWSIAVGAAAEASLQSGLPVDINELFQAHSCQDIVDD